MDLMRRIVPRYTGPTGLPERIALLRRESATRNVENLEELVSFLEGTGWTIVDIGEFSFNDQIRLFAEARHIIAVLGSGLTGLMFSPTGIDILTLAPSNWSDRFFFALMQDRRARLVDIRGRSRAVDPLAAAREPFSVKIDAVAAGLQALNRDAPPAIVNTEGDAAAFNLAGLTKVPSPLLWTAKKLQQSGRFGEAEIVILAAIDLLPSDPEPHRLLAETLFAAGRAPDAVAAALRARNLAPEDAATLSILGKAQIRSAQVAEGIKTYQKALSIDPDDVGLLWTLTKLIELHGPPEVALGLIDRVLALEPANFAAHSQRGHLLARTGDLEAAACAFRTAIAGDPANGGLHEALAHTLGGLRLFSEAVQAGRAAVAAEPSLVRMHVLLARMLRQNGEAEESAQVSQAATALEPADATLRSEPDRMMVVRPSPVSAINGGPLRQQTGDPLVLVDIRAEICRVRDSLTLVPWLLALADRHGSIVRISGQFSPVVHSLLRGLPLQFGEPDQERPLITYIADVQACRDYARPRGLHMCQGHFELAAMQPPTIPMAVEFNSDNINLAPEIVFNPFRMSEDPDKEDDGASECTALLRTLIKALQTRGQFGHIYLIGDAGDDPTPYLDIGVVPLLGRPLGQLYSLLRQAPCFISIDTYLADVAHLGEVCRHLLVYPADDVPAIVSNPRAEVIRAPSDSIDSILSRMSAQSLPLSAQSNIL